MRGRHLFSPDHRQRAVHRARQQPSLRRADDLARGRAVRPGNRWRAFRFALFHDPIYPCDAKPPAAWLMPWVEIFERYGLDVAFVSHSHTYERTCAMRGGHCAAGGVVYLDTGTVAAPPRDVFATLSGTVVGTTRTDDYDCREILESSLGLANQFCHLRIQGCQATTRCYTFDAPRPEPSRSTPGYSTAASPGTGHPISFMVLVTGRP